MVTLKNIAEKTGVNVSTVSRALNNSPEIAEVTKQHIRKIAREMNYVPNVTAQSLVGKKSRSIGLILPEIRSNYYAQISNYIDDELRKRKYSMIIGLTDFMYEEEARSLKVLSSRRVDGILFTSLMHNKIEKNLRYVKNTYKIPIVLVDSFLSTQKMSFDHVGIDSYTGIVAAVRYFLEKGKTTIGFIGDRFTVHSRYPGFQKALYDNGLEVDKRFVRFGNERFEEGGYLRMNELIGAGTIPDALFASYDDMALGALKALDEKGIHPVKDISVIGHDNIRVSAYTLNPLSTINAPLQEMARLSVERLFERIHGSRDKIVDKMLPAELIIRQTS